MPRPECDGGLGTALHVPPDARRPLRTFVLCVACLERVVDGRVSVFGRLSTVDHSARESMKDAAKCEN